MVSDIVAQLRTAEHVALRLLVKGNGEAVLMQRTGRTLVELGVCEHAGLRWPCGVSRPVYVLTEIGREVVAVLGL